MTIGETVPVPVPTRCMISVGIGKMIVELCSTAISAIGSAVSTVPVQALMPLIGWRGVFWLLCGATLAVALWIHLSVPDKPREGPAPTLGAYVTSSARILASPTFWCFGPAVATISTFNFAYLGLWAGPWLRDVAGMEGSARALVLFLYTLAMIAGSMLTGAIATRAERAGLPAVLVPIAALAGVVAVQVGLIAQPRQYEVVLALFLALAILSSAGSVGYVVVNQMFPADLTGRVSTATNTVALGLAFAVQTAVGWILDLWPRTASGGWDPDGYSWAMAMTAALQAVAALVMATAARRRRRA